MCPACPGWATTRASSRVISSAESSKRIKALIFLGPGRISLGGPTYLASGQRGLEGGAHPRPEQALTRERVRPRRGGGALHPSSL